MSLLSEIAAIAYCLIAALAVFRALLTRDPRRRWRWMVVAAIMIALAIWRFSDSEIWVQTLARDWARSHDRYEDRHEVQVPVTIALLTAMALGGFGLTRVRHARYAVWALAAAVTLLLVAALRAVSLHMIDAILYYEIGPLRVNYAVDMGLTALIGGLALVDWASTRASGPKRGRSTRRHGRSRR